MSEENVADHPCNILNNFRNDDELFDISHSSENLNTTDKLTLSNTHEKNNFETSLMLTSTDVTSHKKITGTNIVHSSSQLNKVQYLFLIDKILSNKTILNSQEENLLSKLVEKMNGNIFSPNTDLADLNTQQFMDLYLKDAFQQLNALSPTLDLDSSKTLTIKKENSDNSTVISQLPLIAPSPTSDLDSSKTLTIKKENSDNSTVIPQLPLIALSPTSDLDSSKTLTIKKENSDNSTVISPTLDLDSSKTLTIKKENSNNSTVISPTLDLDSSKTLTIKKENSDNSTVISQLPLIALSPTSDLDSSKTLTIKKENSDNSTVISPTLDLDSSKTLTIKKENSDNSTVISQLPLIALSPTSDLDSSKTLTIKKENSDNSTVISPLPLIALSPTLDLDSSKTLTIKKENSDNSTVISPLPLIDELRNSEIKNNDSIIVNDPNKSEKINYPSPKIDLELSIQDHYVKYSGENQDTEIIAFRAMCEELLKIGPGDNNIKDNNITIVKKNNQLNKHVDHNVISGSNSTEYEPSTSKLISGANDISIRLAHKRHQINDLRFDSSDEDSNELSSKQYNSKCYTDTNTIQPKNVNKRKSSDSIFEKADCMLAEKKLPKVQNAINDLKRENIDDDSLEQTKLLKENYTIFHFSPTGKVHRDMLKSIKKKNSI